MSPSSGNVLTTKPKIRGFEPGRGLWILKGEKIRGTTSFGGEVQLSVPCHKILRPVKEIYEYESDTSWTKFSCHFLAKFPLLF
jgi:hypothetical protein